MPTKAPEAASVPELDSALAGSPRVVAKLSIAAIDPNPWQPRADFPTTELEELMGSIREQGLLQPVVVRKRASRYQLVAGERRLRACKELGWTEIDSIVIEATDQQMLEWAVIENLQRSALSAVETARSFRRLIDDFGLTQEEAARRLGQSRSHVANTIRLLELPGEILGHVSRGTIAPGAARALLSVSEKDAQRQLASRIVAEGLSVRAVEDAVKRLKKGGKDDRPSDPARRANRDEVEQQLQSAWQTKVEIVGGEERGVIRFHYHSKRQAIELVKRLLAAPVAAHGNAEAEE